jgi:hypothetical protein
MILMLKLRSGALAVILKNLIVDVIGIFVFLTCSILTNNR